MQKRRDLSDLTRRRRSCRRNRATNDLLSYLIRLLLLTLGISFSFALNRCSADSTWITQTPEKSSHVHPHAPDLERSSGLLYNKTAASCIPEVHVDSIEWELRFWNVLKQQVYIFLMVYLRGQNAKRTFVLPFDVKKILWCAKQKPQKQRMLRVCGWVGVHARPWSPALLPLAGLWQACESKCFNFKWCHIPKDQQNWTLAFV